METSTLANLITFNISSNNLGPSFIVCQQKIKNKREAKRKRGEKTEGRQRKKREEKREKYLRAFGPYPIRVEDSNIPAFRDLL